MASVGISIPPQEHVTSPVAASKQTYEGSGRHFDAFARRSSGQGGQSERAAAGQRLMRKRSWSMHGDWRSFKRRRKGIVPPTKFLLGGNICDPLNLGSLNDEEANRIANANTPVSSPLPTPRYRKEPIEVIIPPDISDPLGLNGPEALLSPAGQRRRRGKRRRKQPSGHGEPTGRSLSESSAARSSSDGDTAAPPAAAAAGGGVGPELEFAGCETAGGAESGEKEGGVVADPAADGGGGVGADAGAGGTAAAAVVTAETPVKPSTLSLSVDLSTADVRSPSAPRRPSEGPCRRSSEGPSRRSSEGPSRHSSEGPSRRSSEGPSRRSSEGPASRRSSEGPSRRSSEGGIVSPALPQPGGRPAGFGRVTAAGPEPVPVFRERDAAFQYGNYNRYYGYRNPDPDQLDSRLAWLRREWFSGLDVLDVGCNAGHVTLTVARDYQPRRCVGVDIDASLIKAARRNVKHYQRAGGFPMSMRQLYGDLQPPHKAPGTQFPRNVTFQRENFVLESDALLETVRPEFDTVLCLSITKWVHLNFGDAGLRRFFRRVFLSLRPGGRMVLEPQPWPSYVKKRKLTRRIWENYPRLRLRPEHFPDLLINEVGFERYQAVGRPHHSARGFSRQLQLFVKAKEPPAPTSPGAASPADTVAMDTGTATPSAAAVAMDTAPATPSITAVAMDTAPVSPPVESEAGGPTPQSDSAEHEAASVPRPVTESAGPTVDPAPPEGEERTEGPAEGRTGPA